MIAEAAYYANLTFGVCRMLRYPHGGAADFIREHLANREQRFLDLAASRVFAEPANPYRELFRLAGCEQFDLAESVKRCGLEATLSNLAAEGVYLSHDEFKGKTPLMRAGREIPCRPEALLNPVTRGYIPGVSGGSRSRGTPNRKSAEMQVCRDAYEQLRNREFGLHSRVVGLVRPILPSASALRNSIDRVRAGGKIDRWFSTRGGVRDAAHYRVLTHFVVGVGRCLGAPLPWPRYLPPNDVLPVAQWIAAHRREGRLCAIRSFASAAVRIAAAAREADLDISGTMFFVGGEALTPSKRATIEDAGAEVYPSYVISEIGVVGGACRQMKHGNCVHLHRDALAVISRQRTAPLSGMPVNSLMFSTLLTFASSFFINVEMDDSGVLEPATCQCEYSAAGLTTQVRDIFSYGKLTGQGITLLGSDVVSILERALPARFGGAPGDYQLVEKEGSRQTQLILRVSPRTRAASAADVHEFFLNELRKCYGGTLAARLWTHSDGLSVSFEEPCVTAGGKVLPLHVLGLEGHRVHAS